MSSLFNPFCPKVYLTWLVENLIPSESNGSVSLNKDNPSRPYIEEKLSDDSVAVTRMALKIQKIRDCMTPLLTTYGATELFPGTTVNSTCDLKQYINTWSAYGHHMCGTCAMGASDDSVLDSKCKVRGVSKLRVADCSVFPFPWLHGSNTSRGAYVVGEIVSDIIINGD